MPSDWLLEAGESLPQQLLGTLIFWLLRSLAILEPLKPHGLHGLLSPQNHQLYSTSWHQTFCCPWVTLCLVYIALPEGQRHLWTKRLSKWDTAWKTRRKHRWSWAPTRLSFHTFPSMCASGLDCQGFLAGVWLHWNGEKKSFHSWFSPGLPALQFTWSVVCSCPSLGALWKTHETAVSAGAGKHLQVAPLPFTWSSIGCPFPQLICPSCTWPWFGALISASIPSVRTGTQSWQPFILYHGPDQEDLTAIWCQTRGLASNSQV